jgi:hypothetical protein
MNDRQRQLLASVDSAFRGVALGSGVSLHETRVLDDYGTDEQRRAARAPDEKHDWRNLIHDPDLPFLCGVAGGLSFFDAAGMRFHLPACFSRAIQDPEGTRVGDMVESLLFHLTHLDDYQLERFAVLDHAQRSSVREVLEYLREEEKMDDPEVDQAILGYWSQGVAR